MNLIPFGEVESERVKLSKQYNLIEKTGGIWRLTAKCKSNYDPDSYVYYLRGNIDKPAKKGKSREKVITELFNL